MLFYDVRKVKNYANRKYKDSSNPCSQPGSWRGGGGLSGFEPCNHVEFVFRFLRSVQLSQKSLELPTSNYQLGIAPAENTFCHMMELLSWNTSNFFEYSFSKLSQSVNIIYVNSIFPPPLLTLIIIIIIIIIIIYRLEVRWSWRPNSASYQPFLDKVK